MEPIKIFLVDDHKIVRDGIKSLLIGNKKIQVTAEAAHGKELLDLLQTNLPHIIVLDLVLPDIHGVELTRIITTKHPTVKIIILTAEMDEDIILAAVRNGAYGFLNKDISSEEFIDALLLVSGGECYFGQRVSGIIYKSYINKVQNQPDDKLENKISAREKEIISLLSEGLSFKEIGDKLCISPRTVENHKNRILEKLGLKNTIELVKYAIKNNLITL